MTGADPAGPGPVVVLGRFGADEFHELVGTDPEPFGESGPITSFRPKELHLGIFDAGRLVAHAGLVVVPLRPLAAPAGEPPVEAVGVGAVHVARAVRGTGLGRRLMSAVARSAGDLGPDLGLLFCAGAVMAFYAGLGWRPVGSRVVVDQPAGPTTMPMTAMYLPLVPSARPPAGDLRLLSEPM